MNKNNVEIKKKTTIFFDAELIQIHQRISYILKQNYLGAAYITIFKNVRNNVLFKIFLSAAFLIHFRNKDKPTKKYIFYIKDSLLLYFSN